MKSSSASSVKGRLLQINVLDLETTAWGGLEKQTVWLCEGLAGRGHRVRLIQVGHRFFDGQVPEGSGIELVSLSEGERPRDWGFSRWRRELALFPADLNVHAKGSPKWGNLAFDVVSRLGAQLVNIEHHFWFLEKPVKKRYFGAIPRLHLWRRKRIFYQFLRGIFPTRIICVSNGIRKHLQRDFRFPKRKLMTVHNGIDTEQFQFREEWRAEARSAWGVKGDEVVLGSVGRLAEEKGLRILPEMMKKLCARSDLSTLRLVLVGEGALEEELRGAFAREGVLDRVTFAGFSDRPWEAYCGIDVFLMPSLEEGFGLSLAEAMACGCPSICTAVGGMPEIIARPDVGWVVPLGDADALADAAADAITLPDNERENLAERARTWICEAFDAHHQLDRLCDCVLEVVEGNH